MIRLMTMRFLPALIMGALGLWLVAQPLPLFGVAQEAMDVLPLVLAFVGAGFAWFFRRGNVAIGFGLFALWFAIMQQQIDTPLIFNGLALILPLNALLLAWWVDRGVLTSAGLMKCMFLCTQVLIVFLLAYGDNGRFHDASLDAFMWAPVGFSVPFGLSFWVFIAYVIAFVGFAVRIAWKALSLDAGWLAFVLATGFVAVNPTYLAWLGSFAVVGLLLAVIQDSYRMAFLDELTGIPARRALLSDMKKLGNRYVVAMADIDHFKKFNDTHGHDVGDQVLRMVAIQLSRVTGGGRAYRYGGEEFTILFPNKSVAEAMPHLEKVRERIEAASFTLRGPDRPTKKPKDQKQDKPPKTGAGAVVRVTSSFGAAEKMRDTPDPMAVMKKADEALYRAKKAGRNCVST